MSTVTLRVESIGFYPNTVRIRTMGKLLIHHGFAFGVAYATHVSRLMKERCISIFLH